MWLVHYSIDAAFVLARLWRRCSASELRQSLVSFRIHAARLVCSSCSAAPCSPSSGPSCFVVRSAVRLLVSGLRGSESWIQGSSLVFFFFSWALAWKCLCTCFFVFHDVIIPPVPIAEHIFFFFATWGWDLKPHQRGVQTLLFQGSCRLSCLNNINKCLFQVHLCGGSQVHHS